ncbi:MAG: 16S rRNA (guanine(966)-N(2))-methyltransferase RsmD [Calditrichaeota bacterium]|nr:16S rRNA (guanine(966)-N(2))-methyltransferase RsmD [Calditrichota bacterium]
MRVIAGSARGTRLTSTRARWLRPTSDRARQALFDWLGARVEGARVLDLFCGTGALGIEALSRGAREAVFVDVREAALKLVRENLRRAHLEDRAQLVRADVRGALGRLARQDGFDLVFADPPYADARVVKDLLASVWKVLTPGGLLVLERSVRTELPEADANDLALDAEKRVGETVFSIFVRREQRERTTNV